MIGNVTSMVLLCRLAIAALVKSRVHPEPAVWWLVYLSVSEDVALPDVAFCPHLCVCS